MNSLFLLRSARGITLYQCIADNESELSFNVNEIVTQSRHQSSIILSIIVLFDLVRPSREPGWVSFSNIFFFGEFNVILFTYFKIMGTINGKTGLIPENYIAFTGGV